MADYTQSLPGIGAYWAGQRERQDQEQNQAKLMELQQALKIKEQEAAFAQQSNPLKLEEMSLRNQGLQAGLPGIMADVEGKQLGVAKTKATQDSSIKATNAENIFKADATKAKRVGAMAEAFTQFGPLLKQLPDAPGARANVLRTLMGQSGYSLDTPEGQAFAKILESTPSAQLPDTLISMGEQLIKMTGPYIQATSVANINKEAQKEIAADNRAAQIKMNNDRIQSSERKAASKQQIQDDAKELISQVQAGKLTFEKAATTYKVKALLEKDPTLKQEYEGVAAQFEQANLNAKNATAQGKPDMSGAGIATQTVTPALGGGAAPAAPKKNSLADVQKMYPGIPADKLREAYKKKFGVDLQ